MTLEGLHVDGVPLPEADGPIREYLAFLATQLMQLSGRLERIENQCVTHEQLAGLTETIATVGCLLNGIKDRMTVEG